jgi:hypothetical protein
MLENSWRERLKSGPLSNTYSRLRRLKRQVLREPLGEALPLTFERWSIDALLPLAARYPDRARAYFSLMLAYLARAQQGDLARARACLRCAAALDFESPERLKLYAALLDAQGGSSVSAAELMQELPSYEWTPAERELLRSAASAHDVSTGGAREAPVARRAPGAVPRLPQVRSLLVLDDERALSATWLPDAPYFLASPRVTGVSAADLPRLGRRFELGIRPVSAAATCDPSLCDAWLELDFAALEHA